MDERLAVEAVHRDGEARHVGAEGEEGRERRVGEEAEPREDARRNGDGAPPGQDEPPLPERRDRRVVGARREAGGGDRPLDDPVRVPGEEGGGRLDGEGAVRVEAAREEGVEADGVELADGEGVRVGEVDEGEVEEAGLPLAPLQPEVGVLVDDADLRRKEGAAVEPREEGEGPRQLRDGGVEVDEDNLLDRRVLQDFADGQAVPSAQDEDAPSPRDEAERRVDERLVVAVLVDRGELEVPVEEELEPGAVLRDDDALVGRRPGEDDLVGVLRLLGQVRQPVGRGERGDEDERDEARPGEEAPGGAEPVAEDPDRGEGDDRVQEACLLYTSPSPRD